MYKKFCLLIAGVTMLSSSLSALAQGFSQWQNQGQTQSRGNAAAGNQYDSSIGRPLTENKGTVSTVVPDLPYLPPYSGFKPIVDSVVTYKRTQGTGFTIAYDTFESREQVCQFYKDAFKANKWTQQTNQNPYQFTFIKQKEGVSCTISAAPAARPDRRCRLWIGYSFIKPFDPTDNDPNKQQHQQP